MAEEDPSQLRRLLSNALHDLAVCLERCDEHDMALETFNDSLRMRMVSIKIASSIQDEHPRRAAEETKLLRERYRKTLWDLNELRRRAADEDEEDEDGLNRLDLFPLLLQTNDPANGGPRNSPFFLPPIPRLVELGEAPPSSSSHSTESTRTLLNMALCHLSKLNKTTTHTHHLNRAEQYLSMTFEVLPEASQEEEEDGTTTLLLTADLALAESVVALASRRERYDVDAEARATDALSLYYYCFNEEDQKSTELQRRRAKEGAADALSLLLRVRHLTGRTGDDARLRFDELIMLRSELHGTGSLRVAAAEYNAGVTMLTTIDSSGLMADQQQVASSEARESIQALAYHPSLMRRQRRYWLSTSLVLAETARALEALDDDLEDALGIKFYTHAGAA